MKKTLWGLAISICASIVLGVGFLFLYQGAGALGYVWGILLNDVSYIISSPWDVGHITVVGVLAVLLAAIGILIYKLIRKKKSFVTWLVILDLLTMGVLVGAYFIPNPSISPNVLSSLLSAFGNTGNTLLVRIGAIATLIDSGLTVVLTLAFFIFALIDIALTPTPMKQVGAEEEAIAAAAAAPVADQPVYAEEQPVQPEAQPIYTDQPVASEAQPEYQPVDQPAEDIRSIIRQELEGLRAIIHEEVAKSNADLPSGYSKFVSIVPSQSSSAQPLTPQGVAAPAKEDIRALVKEELAKSQAISSEEIRAIVKREVEAALANLTIASKAAPEVKPVVESKPVEVKPVVVSVKEEAAPVAEKQPEPAVVETKPAEDVIPEIIPIQPEEDEANKKVIIRIPFEERMKVAEQGLLDNYNELKNYILSYGVKSRVSNSGDTFRLHTETYVKITIAGKGLKLYYALDPKDFANSTIPVTDVSRKGIYAEIPACFKVKSVLSVKRAKQLVDDLMAKKGLAKGEVENVDYAKDFR